MQTLLPKRAPLYVLLFFVAAAVGCAGQVRVAAVADAIGGPDSVTGRHDAYVQADEDLTDLQRAAYLSDSARIVAAVEGAVAAEKDTVSAGPLVDDIDSVVGRHNTYITLDEELSPIAD
jgi:hypothetical protein